MVQRRVVAAVWVCSASLVGACASEKEQHRDATGGIAAELELVAPPASTTARCALRTVRDSAGGALMELASEVDGWVVSLPAETGWTFQCDPSTWGQARWSGRGIALQAAVWRFNAPGADMISLARGLQLQVGRVTAQKLGAVSVREGIENDGLVVAWREDRLVQSGVATRLLTWMVPAVRADGTLWGVSATAMFDEQAEPAVRELAEVSVKLATMTFRVDQPSP